MDKTRRLIDVNTEPQHFIDRTTNRLNQGKYLTGKKNKKTIKIIIGCSNLWTFSIYDCAKFQSGPKADTAIQSHTACTAQSRTQTEPLRCDPRRCSAQEHGTRTFPPSFIWYHPSLCNWKRRRSALAVRSYIRCHQLFKHIFALHYFKVEAPKQLQLNDPHA